MAEPRLLLLCLCGQCPSELVHGQREGWIDNDRILDWVRGRCRPVLVGSSQKRFQLVIGGHAHG
ncbi:MAG: hypothetical protein EPN91_09415 [Salinibacterium sp.]|nr:MAG: hypothetical protein EPN91_09415 [Salinibacterium sp.]